jgi:AcrR family transcriptional regulator
MRERMARGRPRLPNTDDKILRATLNLMARRGYARMTVDAVAAEAGVTKPTIYLRFRNKEGLASAALAAAKDWSAPAEIGDTRTDLIAQLHHFQRGLAAPFGMSLLGTVLAEEQETPALLALYRNQVLRPRRAMIRSVLDRARDRKELSDDADLTLAIDMLVGSYYAGVVAGHPPGTDWPETIADTVLRAVRWREQPENG